MLPAQPLASSAELTVPGAAPGEGILPALALSLSNNVVDPVSELAYAGVHGRRADVAVAVSPGDDADQGPDIPVLVYQRSARVTLRRRHLLLSGPSTCSKLVPATPATLATASCYSLNLWLHRCKTPRVLLLLHPPWGAAGARLLTWQEEAPTPPAQSMELVIRLPQYCTHWLWEIKGRVTCCRRVAKAWARGKKHH